MAGNSAPSKKGPWQRELEGKMLASISHRSLTIRNLLIADSALRGTWLEGANLPARHAIHQQGNWYSRDRVRDSLKLTDDVDQAQ